jgi:hypothetical protein
MVRVLNFADPLGAGAEVRAQPLSPGHGGTLATEDAMPTCPGFRQWLSVSWIASFTLLD